MTTPIDTIVASIVSLYRRTMDGEDVEHLTVTHGELELQLVRPSYWESAPTLMVGSPFGWHRLFKLPGRGIRTTTYGEPNDAEVAEDATQGALALIAVAARMHFGTDGSPHPLGIDPLSMLVRIYRECAASQVEAERLQGVTTP
jgi:hypothetical protein